MRIAFLNRGRETMPGGDCVALDATMEALRRRGHIADEIGWVADKLKDYDICHMFHCNFSWSWGNYQAIQEAKKPYVLTPIYYPGPLLSGITQKQLTEIVTGARRLFPFSTAERYRLAQGVIPMPRDAGNLEWHDERTDAIETNCIVIPNATDKIFHHSPLRGLGDDDRVGVLTVSARGNSDKGVPLVATICERNGIYHFNASDLEHDSLSTLYPYYAVFVNASGSERMSLTIGEALCAGCRVLATDQNWGNSWYEGLVTFDPTDEVKLEHLIRWALSSPVWDYRPNAAARCLTWDWVAEKLEGVYREVLGAQ